MRHDHRADRRLHGPGWHCGRLTWPAPCASTTATQGRSVPGRLAASSCCGIARAVQPDDLAYTFLADGENESDALTWSELDRASRAVAAMAAGATAARRSRAAALSAGSDFIAAFFGCLYAGVLAVPVLPPQAARAPGVDRLAVDRRPTRTAVCADLRPSFISNWRTTRVTAARHDELGTPWVATDRHLVRPGRPAGTGCRTRRDDRVPAVHVGLDGAPKGVMVTHGNLLHNLTRRSTSARHDRGAVSVSWLPVPRHGPDRGRPAARFSGCPAYLMSPGAFLQRPVRWLRADLDVPGDAQRRSELRLRPCASAGQRRAIARGSTCAAGSAAYNGAEPIRHDTMASRRSRDADSRRAASDR